MSVYVAGGYRHRLVNPMSVGLAKSSFVPIDPYSNVRHFVFLDLSPGDDIRNESSQNLTQGRLSA